MNGWATNPDTGVDSITQPFTAGIKGLKGGLMLNINVFLESDFLIKLPAIRKMKGTLWAISLSSW